ncbi:MAG: hypothetical protein MJ219_04720 [Mycoplasmoidaceae bacterium]|nr:hypothetical protein [Mycoplasmoidaceae bacterium]
MSDVFQTGATLYDSPYIVDKVIGSGGDGDVYIVHLKNEPKVKYAAKVFKKPEKVNDDY